MAEDSAPVLNELLSTPNSTVGAFDGFAGETKEWGHEFVRVVVKVPKRDALELKDTALIRLNW